MQRLATPNLSRISPIEEDLSDESYGRHCSCSRAGLTIHLTS